MMVQAGRIDALEMLLGVARSPKPPTGPTQGLGDYDWTRPNILTHKQIEHLTQVAQKLAAQLEQALESIVRSKVDLSRQGVRQHYCQHLSGDEEHAGGYWLGLVDDSSKPCGAMWLAASSAVAWVSRLLGGAVAADAAGRELSSLENSLLADICQALADAVAAGFGGKGRMRAAGGVSRTMPAVGGECIEIWLAAGASDCLAMCLVMDAPSLLAMTNLEKPSRKAPEELRKDILAHLEGVPVVGEVWLGSGRLAVRDLMSLEAGDVILLETLVGQAVEMLIQGRPSVVGLPASRDGHYAIQVTGRAAAQPPGGRDNQAARTT